MVSGIEARESVRFVLCFRESKFYAQNLRVEFIAVLGLPLENEQSIPTENSLPS
jgi:hypothetical protein